MQVTESIFDSDEDARVSESAVYAFDVSFAGLDERFIDIDKSYALKFLRLKERE
jgi:hypothetical protein